MKNSRMEILAMGLSMLFVAGAPALAQTISITGTVQDSTTSVGIAGVKIRLVELPACTTRTDATGAFTLGGITRTNDARSQVRAAGEITLLGNHLMVARPGYAGPVVAELFAVNGARIAHMEQSIGASGRVQFSIAGHAAGLFYAKVRIGSETLVVGTLGRTVLPALSAAVQFQGASKSAASVYTVEANRTGYRSKQIVQISATGTTGTMKLVPYAPALGTWQDVTPAGVDLLASSSYGGVQTVLADPARPSDLYMNVDCQGTWRSTDYGVTWKKVNTGTNGDKLNNGRQWYAGIDMNPDRDPATFPDIYTDLGYGTLGLWKSTDGGVSWVDKWVNNIFGEDGVTNISTDVGVDMHSIQFLEPGNKNHLIATLHSYSGTQGNSGIYETTDGGATWILHKTPVQFQNHADILFATSPRTWLISYGGGSVGGPYLHRSTDAGATWGEASITNDASALGRLYCKSGTTMYASSGGNNQNGGLFKSTDDGAHWKKMPGFNVATGIVCTKKNVYASSVFWDTTTYHLKHAPLTNDTAWVEDVVPAGQNAGWTRGGIGTGVMGSSAVTNDGTHAIVISANAKAGVWRYIEP